MRWSGCQPGGKCDRVVGRRDRLGTDCARSVSNRAIMMFQYPLRFHLGLLGQICLLLLVLVGIYTVYFAIVALTRLRSLRAVDDDDIRARSLAALNHRSVNSQQILTSMFYFFGLALFVQLQEAFWTPDSRNPVGLMVLENFRVCFRFAALVFLVLLALHSIQWLACSRIRKAAFRLGKREAT
jgi:hypothetical protein